MNRATLPTRRFIHWLLAVCLLILQAGVAAHAISHVSGHHPDGNTTPDAPCALCLAHAGGTGPASEPAGLPLLATADERPPAFAAEAYAPAFVPLYRSRAPPVFGV